jgi:hypothetical protein
MTEHTFLDAAWIERFNADIRAVPRQVIALPDTRLRLRVLDGPAGTRPSVILGLDENEPILLADPGPGSGETVTAEIELPYDLLRTMFLEGDMLAGVQACEDGRGTATGRRETLLYFLYHLFPDGPEGARRTAEAVSAYTAA